MKPISTPYDSTLQRTHWKFAFIALILVSLLSSCSQAADQETPKAVRRTSPDDVSVPKGQKRVALVIGNSDYKVGPLRNPAHDAEDISGVLRTLGFIVQTRTNVSQREMEEAVNRFVQEIQNGDVALFYFSGHGVQVKGENYLIPLGDSVATEADVRFKTLNAGLVLAKMEESRNRANIVILDACRNNPFKGLFRSPSMGLSRMNAPKGTFVAYATSPDSVAADGAERNSPYTKHLIEALKVKDIPIEQAFKQVARAVNKETGGQQTPWISSSLLDEFCCNPSSAPSLPAPQPPRAAAAPGSEPSLDYQAQLEREKQESEQEIAKLREARRVTALERERLEREKQEMQREMERVASLPAATPARGDSENVERGSLGVNIQDIHESLAKSFGLPNTNGALVARVVAGTPADKAGIKVEDVILEYDGHPVSRATELLNTVRADKPGSAVKLIIFRKKKTLSVSVTPSLGIPSWWKVF